MSVCRISEVAEIITDAGIPQDELERLRSAGVQITIAQEQP